MRYSLIMTSNALLMRFDSKWRRAVLVTSSTTLCGIRLAIPSLKAVDIWNNKNKHYCDVLFSNSNTSLVKSIVLLSGDRLFMTYHCILIGLQWFNIYMRTCI